MEGGSPAFIPKITGNEYLFLPMGNSIGVPTASIKKIFEPMRANATGYAHRSPSQCDSATNLITLADRTHGICSNCAFRWAKGMKNMLRPMSPPMISITCERE